MEDSEYIQRRLGLRCANLRLELGESQLSFAHRIGMDRTQYCAIENGRRNVTLTNLSKIAAGFGISLAELVKGV